jgi:hypothetical protein
MAKDKRLAYLEPALEQVERLMSNMDRNRGSKTFGCLCRPYWHDKTMDFPSAHQQIGVLPLAVVYGKELEDNPYHQSERIGELCRAGIKYWASIQKKDGSFDEHYPNEHSLGATAWTLWAVAESYEMLEDPPEIEHAVMEAVEFLQNYSEPGEIANHRAVAANALMKASEIVEVDREVVEEKLEEVRRMQSDEGWFQEYHGADIGYQSTTISHLAQIWKQEPELVEDPVLEDALDFFSAFIDRENYYGMRLGSRHTQHVHPTGFEILAGEFEEAGKISAAVRQNLADGKLLEPRKMDDKHFSRLQAEYLLAHLEAGELDLSPSEVRSREFQNLLVRNNGKKVFVDKSRGGYLKAYRDGKLEVEDTGICTRIGGEHYTSNWPGSGEEVSREGTKLTVEGSLYRVPDNRLDGWKFIANRLFQRTLGKSPVISLAVKKRVIDHVISGSKSSYRFTRKIDLETGDTQSEFPGKEIDGKSRSNFVPSSEFFYTE